MKTTLTDSDELKDSILSKLFSYEKNMKKQIVI